MRLFRSGQVVKAEMAKLAGPALGDDPRTALRAVAQLRLVSGRREVL